MFWFETRYSIFFFLTKCSLGFPSWHYVRLEDISKLFLLSHIHIFSPKLFSILFLHPVVQFLISSCCTWPESQFSTNSTSTVSAALFRMFICSVPLGTQLHCFLTLTFLPCFKPVLILSLQLWPGIKYIFHSKWLAQIWRKVFFYLFLKIIPLVSVKKYWILNVQICVRKWHVLGIHWKE